MTDASNDGGERRKFSRSPVSLLVQYRFNTFEEFLAEHSINISPGGMFIRTEEVREEGSIIYLQFTLRDGSKLIEGMGRVVRVNPPPDTPEQLAGMGIEFLSFDEESMSLVEEICSVRDAQAQSKN